MSEATRMLVGGELLGGEGEPLTVENPYTEETLAEVRLPSEAQLDAAIAAEWWYPYAEGGAGPPDGAGA